MAEGATAGDIALMATDMTEAAGMTNPDAAAGGAAAGAVPMSPSESQRLSVASTFLNELCAGLNRDVAPNLSPEEVSKLASLHLAPNAVVHVDGLLHSMPPVTGPDGFVSFITLERAAYRTVALEPLLMALSPEGDTVFAFSHFKMKNVGPWHGKEPTKRVSEGVRVDELRFNEGGQVVEAWCNRQLFEEERSLLLRDPDRHHPAKFESSMLVPVPVADAGTGGLMAPEQLMRVAQIWAETWNTSAVAGPPDPDSLDMLADHEFHVMDALGFTGDDAQSHPYTAIRSLGDAKKVLMTLSQKYDIDEVLHRAAAKPGFNAVFAHWRAKLVPRADATAGTSADVVATAGAAAAAGPFVAEATDLLVFNPASGKIRAVLQFRKPLGSDRRLVLVDVSPAGMPEAEMVMGA